MVAQGFGNARMLTNGIRIDFGVADAPIGFPKHRNTSIYIMFEISSCYNLHSHSSVLSLGSLSTPSDLGFDIMSTAKHIHAFVCFRLVDFGISENRKAHNSKHWQMEKTRAEACSRLV